MDVIPIGAGEIAILAGAALLTATLSAVVGMAGGITLLAVMLLFLYFGYITWRSTQALSG